MNIGSRPTSATWLQWVEPWYVAYGLLGTAVAGLVPIMLPLAVHSGGGPAHVGWVVAAYNLGGLTAPLWGTLLRGCDLSVAAIRLSILWMENGLQIAMVEEKQVPCRIGESTPAL